MKYHIRKNKRLSSAKTIAQFMYIQNLKKFIRDPKFSSICNFTLVNMDDKEK